jgi:hypothetical protein
MTIACLLANTGVAAHRRHGDVPPRWSLKEDEGP